MERRFGRPSSAKLALERRLSRPGNAEKTCKAKPKPLSHNPRTAGKGLGKPIQLLLRARSIGPRRPGLLMKPFLDSLP